MYYVYFIHPGSKKTAVKIGCASDVKSRIAALQTGNHNIITLWNKLTFSNSLEALNAEKKIQQWLAPYRLKGEWFEYNPIVQDVLNYIISTGYPHCILQMDRVAQFIRVLYDNPKFEAIAFETETIIYGDGGFHFTAGLDTPLGFVDRID